MIVASYYGKLNVLWEEFHNHEPIIQCTCCSSVPRVIYMRIVMPLINLLHEFLMGLDSDYHSTVCTNILSQDPLPTLDRAYQLVVQA